MPLYMKIKVHSLEAPRNLNNAQSRLQRSFQRPPSGGVSISNLNLSDVPVGGATSANATSAISSVDSALATVSEGRTEFGAASQRLVILAANSTIMRTNSAVENSVISTSTWRRRRPCLRALRSCSKRELPFLLKRTRHSIPRCRCSGSNNALP